MSLVSIAPPAFDVQLSLAYASFDNFTGRPVYARPDCWLHADAADALRHAIELAAAIGLGLRIFDAFRPQEAQWALWHHTPDPEFLADPRRGSIHSRGAAIDLTLVDGNGQALDMGTGFDAFTPLSHHGNRDLSIEVQKNRYLLLGIMRAAGWDFYSNEWWHYQLVDADTRYPLLSDSVLARPMMH
ncbi:D-alanyl-D-alanine dipeptidase [Telmatospirillum sp.]|uniref:D-alanyl-D-alanine dipeptidase n=1 Tax=Telmatospirillum sp. TaxID=2079197 RepID=UPI00283D8703|nr:D-alanyl-D-alanine dipeptidase [Telmatospirillum sp.]MDR3440412.1 D-alanyl-D-alanine dipeptidase [Telmatospirillum sp.]